MGDDIPAAIKGGDTDGDGKLQAREVNALYRAMAGQIATTSGDALVRLQADMRVVNALAMSLAAPEQEILADLATGIDTKVGNKDGKLTASEVDAFIESRTRHAENAQAKGDHEGAKKERYLVTVGTKLRALLEAPNADR